MEVITFIMGTFGSAIEWCSTHRIFGANILYILLSFWVLKKIIEWFINEKEEVRSIERAEDYREYARRRK